MIDERAFRVLSAIIELGGARFTELKKVVRNPKTLTEKLRYLESLGLVEKRSGVYVATDRGRRVAAKLEEVERLLRAKPRVKNVERIPHAFLAPVIGRFCEALYEVLGERLVSVVVFGSLARGCWSRDSDVDVLIVAEGWERVPVWDRLREIRRAERLIEASPEYAQAVSRGFYPILQPYPLSVKEAQRFNRIYLDMVLEGIILYDHDGFMEKVLNRVRKRLEEIGAVRVSLPSGRHYWVLGSVSWGEVVRLE